MISDGVRSFTYDALNRLTGVTGGSTPVTLSYDPFGRLGSYTASGATTSFRYAGPNLSAEYNGTTLLRSYASGEGADQWMLWMEGPSGAGSLRWLHQDRQGSVIAVSDAAGVVTPYAYGMVMASRRAGRARGCATRGRWRSRRRSSTTTGRGPMTR